MSDAESMTLIEAFKFHAKEADELSSKLQEVFTDHHIIPCLMAMGAVIGMQVSGISDEQAAERSAVLAAAIDFQMKAQSFLADKKNMN